MADCSNMLFRALLRSDALAAGLAGWVQTRSPLPWRDRPAGERDPYATWIAEVMLQQTTVAVVRQRLPAFLDRFPDPEALAGAGEATIVDAWAGLGYYSRARHLHRAAERILRDHDGRLPEDVEALAALPGIGPYTAAAIAALAFGRPVLGLDTNVARVLLRLAGREESVTGLRRRTGGMLNLGNEVGKRAGALLEGLMDLGRLICRLRAPRCAICPAQTVCAAYRAGLVDRIPAPEVRPARKRMRVAAYVLVDGDGRVYGVRRDAGLLAGTWCVPLSPPLADDEDGNRDPQALTRHAPLKACWQVVSPPVRHLFTHVDMTAVPLKALLPATANAKPAMPGMWLDPGEIHRCGSAFVRKILHAAGVGAA